MPRSTQVTAAKDTVLERARRRGEITKRVVPDEVLLASLEQVRGCMTRSNMRACKAGPKSPTVPSVPPPHQPFPSLMQTPRAVAELAPLVDYCVTIDNDGREPRLVMDAPGAQSWRIFSSVWRDCFLPTKAGGAPPPSR